MQQSLKNIKGILVYTAVLSAISAVYFVYAYFVYPVVEERETFLTELGEEVFGKIDLTALLFTFVLF